MSTRNLFLPLLLALLAPFVHAADKPKISLDEFFNAVDFPAVRISPDGHSVVIAVERSDWNQNFFRNDLWLYTDDGHNPGTLTQLTQSGRDSDPRWSPDGHWIAFVSERKQSAADDSDSDSGSKAGGEEVSQLYLIAPGGGEAFPVTQGEESVHAFAWAPDSRSLYFATRLPWNKEQKVAYKKEWKDVEQFRAAERGDVIFSIQVEAARANRAKVGTVPADEDAESDVTPGSHALVRIPLRVAELVASPDGRSLAFASEAISQREEKVGEFEIYTAELEGASPDRPPHQLTRNHGLEEHLQWTSDSRRLFFQMSYGSVEGKYKDHQTDLYWIDAESGEVQRWAGDFSGWIDRYDIATSGGVIASAREGTEVQIYTQSKLGAPFAKQPGWMGTYERVSTSEHSARVAFLYSALDKATEVYLADGPDKLQQARAITSFNKLFAERDLPKGKPYRWTADDGTPVEGMLMYPPGKFEAKNLPMFVFIHGGPDDADGNHFQADWYVWDRMAATQGWLVFEPNYRGSTGYGDKFLEGIVPYIVSRPGKDILEGVDALVKDGIADPAHLTVGGYSYGGYMTNWLITQTTRFKAAVTGAGVVEHIANWGNDDTTFDDEYFLGGPPWEAAQQYHDEAAIFQIAKVKTPTHIVVGSDDIRVAAAEAFILDRALHELNVPSTLLIFPGEGHSLEKNPWHSKIKVREELKWLQKYGGVGQAP